MSEYQYYEFQAIDRPLTNEERREISRISSRTEATSTRAVFTYSYSDFPRNPITILRQYFDAFIYLSNWGSRRLAFRFPASALDLESILAYQVADRIEMDSDGVYVVVELHYFDEDGDWGWVEGEGWLSSLATLRSDILQGDFRALYLMWLKTAIVSMSFFEDEEENEEDYEDDWPFEISPTTLEPPVPAGLKELTGPLKELMDFFDIGQIEAEVAAQTSSKGTMEVRENLPVLVDRLSDEGENGIFTAPGYE